MRKLLRKHQANHNMYSPLSDKTILITRPKKETQEMAKRFKLKGALPVEAPMIKFEPLNIKATAANLAMLQRANLVVVTSQRAAIFLNLDSSMLVSNILEKQTIAVGPKTASELRKVGFLNVAIPKKEYSSEGILTMDQMAQRKVCGENIVLVKGLGGRSILSAELKDRGAKILPIDLYKRVNTNIKLKPLLNNLSIAPPDIIVATSGSILLALKNTIEREELGYLYSITLLVVSERLKEHAKNMGFNGRILISNGAENGIIIDFLESWIAHND